MSRSTRVWGTLLAVIIVVVPAAAIAADRFVDVPASNIFHDDIGWLADARVTLGCNPPQNDRFCPSDKVSRAQMAAFMHRLARNQVVDAGSVQGRTGAEMTSRASFVQSEGLPDEDVALETEITAPAPGVLVMNGAVDITLFDDGLSDTVVCEFTVDEAQVTGTGMFASVGGDASSNSEENICSSTGALSVDAGTYTVAFNIFSVEDAELYQGSMNVVWVPLDGAGSVPSPASPAPATGSTAKPVN